MKHEFAFSILADRLLKREMSADKIVSSILLTELQELKSRSEFADYL
jgi:hypothetical protein